MAGKGIRVCMGSQPRNERVRPTRSNAVLKMLYCARHEKALTWTDINIDNLTVKTHRDSNRAVSALCDCPWTEDQERGLGASSACRTPFHGQNGLEDPP